VLCPLQIASVPVMVTVGAGPALTVTEAVEEPHAFVAVAVYVSGVVTEMEALVEPVLHNTEPTLVAVKVMGVPAQTVVGPEMDTEGAVPAVTVTDWVTDPQLLLPVTEYGPVADTVMFGPSSPVLHT